MSRRFTNFDFIQKSVKFHGDKYDYSLVDYKNDSTEVQIICHEHGSFYQKPNVHYRSGCPDCGLLKRANNRKKNLDEIINSFKEKHGYKYDYSFVKYVRMVDKVKIKCNVHNNFFFQTPEKHLLSKNGGCPKCNSVGKGIMTSELFINKSRDIHYEKYDYDQVDYIRSNKKVKINCKKHGIFEMTPNSHLTGRGCPNCNRNGSILEKLWLDFHKIPTEYRQYKLGNYFVDGIDINNKIVYEFYGDFWHGNPNKYNQDEFNKVSNISFGELYQRTIDREKEIKSMGYQVESIWEGEYKKIFSKK